MHSPPPDARSSCSHDRAFRCQGIACSVSCFYPSQTVAQSRTARSAPNPSVFAAFVSSSCCKSLWHAANRSVETLVHWHATSRWLLQSGCAWLRSASTERLARRTAHSAANTHRSHSEGIAALTTSPTKAETTPARSRIKFADSQIAKALGEMRTLPLSCRVRDCCSPCPLPSARVSSDRRRRRVSEGRPSVPAMCQHESSLGRVRVSVRSAPSTARSKERVVTGIWFRPSCFCALRGRAGPGRCKCVG